MIATKEQERKALEQIRKIVEGLGEGSYIGIAFEGCFEIAEENIDNDIACSMKQRAERIEENLKDLQKSHEECIHELEAKQQTIKNLNTDLIKEQEKVIDLQNSKSKTEEENNKLRVRLVSEIKNAKNFQAEVIRLKAKLYDYMTREQEG